LEFRVYAVSDRLKAELRTKIRHYPTGGGLTISRGCATIHDDIFEFRPAAPIFGREAKDRKRRR
jgi:hypothetical protein